MTTPQQVDLCQTVGCLKCRANNLGCEECNAGLVYYNTPGNTCVKKEDIQPGQGFNPDSNRIESCYTGCLDCKEDKNKCVQCDSGNGFYLSSLAMCFNVDPLIQPYMPPKFRGVYQTGLIEPCDPGCDRCIEAKHICDSCTLDEDFYRLPNKTCLIKQSLPDGLGAGLGGEALPCAVANCKLCKFNNLLCEKCDARYNLDIVTFDLCTFNPFITLVVIEMEEVKSRLTPRIDHSVLFKVRTLENPLPGATAAIYDYLKQNMDFKADFFFRDELKLIPISKKLHLINNQLFADITLEAAVDDLGEYFVQISSLSEYRFTHQGMEYYVLNYAINTTMERTISSQDLKSAAARALEVSKLSGYSGNIGIKFIVLMAALIDKTGLMTKAFQTFEILGKLALSAQDFGFRLRIFWDVIVYQFEPRELNDPNSILLSSDSYRNNISRLKLHVEVFNTAKLSITLYLIFFAWCLLNRVVFQRYQVYKPYLWVMYYLPRFHLVIFQINLPSLAFYSMRNLFQSRVSFLSILIALIVSVALSVDLWSFVSLIWDDASWKKIYTRLKRRRVPAKKYTAYKKLNPKELKELTTAVKKELEEQRVVKPDDHVTTDSDKDFLRDSRRRRKWKVNYKKTYEDFDMQKHSLIYLYFPLREVKEVYNSKWCRAFYAVHLLRVLVYQIVSLTTQYLPSFGIWTFLFLEIGVMLYHILVGFLWNFYKFKVLYLFQIGQSFIFFVFFCMTLNTVSSTQITTSPSFQDWGMTFIYMGVVIEYLMLCIVKLVSYYSDHELYKDIKKYNLTKAKKKDRVNYREIFFIHYFKPKKTDRLDSEGEEIEDEQSVESEKENVDDSNGRLFHDLNDSEIYPDQMRKKEEPRKFRRGGKRIRKKGLIQPNVLLDKNGNPLRNVVFREEAKDNRLQNVVYREDEVKGELPKLDLLKGKEIKVKRKKKKELEKELLDQFFVPQPIQELMEEKPRKKKDSIDLRPEDLAKKLRKETKKILKEQRTPLKRIEWKMSDQRSVATMEVNQEPDWIREGAWNSEQKEKKVVVPDEGLKPFEIKDIEAEEWTLPPKQANAAGDNNLLNPFKPITKADVKEDLKREEISAQEIDRDETRGRGKLKPDIYSYVDVDDKN
jgi:hypothetical protein